MPDAPVPSPPAPPDGDTWLALVTDPLAVDHLIAWATTPDRGAVLTFQGTARDHSPGRPGVTELAYEAYPEHVEPRMAEVVAGARARWDGLGRIGIWHRVGRMVPTETAVLVTVAATHRQQAFAAAAHCIDTVKETVPIWKKEIHAAGASWALDTCADRAADALGAG